MSIQFSEILPYIVSAVTGVVGLLVGKRKQNNDFLQDMQSSIDKLTSKNTELVQQVLNLNDEVIKLRRENAELRAKIESLTNKFSNVKTITRTK